MIINENNEIIWSIEFIQKYRDIWCWTKLSSRNNLPWSIELIQLYEDKWDWSKLSSNHSLHWSIELIEHYKDNWNWKKLTSNKSLPWSKELIMKFNHKWDFDTLSKERGDFWSIELIKFYDGYWKWSELSSNKSLPWSIELINSFYSQWNWNNLSSNSNLPWSIELITKFERSWNWRYLNSNYWIPLSIELITKFEKKWHWNSLSRKQGNFWSIELIKHFEAKWDWRELSLNRSLPWSEELIKQFDSKWKFNIFHNKKINWSNELLDKFQNRFNDQSLELTELLEMFDGNWFEIEWESKHNQSAKTNSWSTDDDKICENFIKWNSNIEHTILKLEDWLELYNSDYLYKTAKKITKNSYNKSKFKVTFKKWENIFWKKTSASNNINFEFINKFRNELDWNILIKNSSLNWTLNEMNLFANHLSVEPNLWTVLKPHINSTIVNILLQNATKIDPILNYNHYTPNYHNIFSVITFGKYKGKTLYEIIRIDRSYINWCIINLNHFYINDFTLNGIKIFYTDFELSPIATKTLEEKTLKMRLQESKTERNNDYDYEKPQSFEDWLDTEFGDEAGMAYWNLE